ncbi:adenylate/guanylate cyclase domain-containing protein [Rhodovulum viride]|uniref:adenylate/guanylate cyclase domain-containing protein n=1 Tax=Rhodovulum viride TaxID=1231134 RepID=UPI0015EBCD21|nr:adenylate/guanylate cyclase domain-containing protein [Rhodovulum viride]
MEGTILVMDIADSTKMKEETEEVGWLGNYAKAFDIILQNIPESGEVVKYLGDGIMVFFREDEQTDAINAAIRTQEALEKAKEDKIIKVVFSTGVASGKFWRVPLGNDRFDYLGQVVDKAFRLCSAAMPKAIFVDADTVVAANVTKVRSTVGSALRRKPAEYVGKTASIQLKGFAKLVEYHSVHWTGEQFGVKPSPSEGGALDGRSALPAKARSLPQSTSDHEISLIGKFTEWRGNSGRVRTESGNEYFCHKGNVPEGLNVEAGQEVFFIERPTGRELPMAEHMVPLGASFEGEVVDAHGKNVFLRSAALSTLGHENVYLFWEDEIILKHGDRGTFYLGKGFSKQKNRYTLRAEGFERL